MRMKTARPKHRPPAQRRKIPRKWLIVAAAPVLLGLLAMLVVPLFVDAEQYQQSVVSQVKSLTGHSLVVKNGSRFRMFPSPRLTLNGVEMEPDADDPSAESRFRADALILDLPWSAAFSGKPEISGLRLVQPVMEFLQGGPKSTQLDWLTELPTALGEGNASIEVSIENGRIIYLNSGLDYSERLESINLSGGQSADHSFRLKGALVWRDLPMEMNALLGAMDENGARPVEISLINDENNQLSFTGTLPKAAKDAPLFSGDFALRLQPKPARATASDDNPEEQNPVEESFASLLPPFSLAGKLSYNNEIFTLADASFDTSDSSAKGAMNAALKDKAEFNVRMAFTRLKVPEAWLTKLFAPKAGAGSPIFRAPQQINLISPKLHVVMDVTADSLFVGKQSMDKVELKAEIVNGSIQVENLDAMLAGNTHMILKGEVQDTAKGSRFQGTADVSGESLRSALGMIEPAVQQLPEKSLGSFYVKSNLFISNEQLRLSEADVKIADLQLSGGLVTYFEARPRVEADIALKDTNLDYFRDTWREELKNGGEQSFTFKVNSSVDFSWLRQFHSIIDLKVNLQGFTFLDKRGNSGSFRLYAQQNEMGIYNMEMRYPTGVLRSGVKVNVSTDLPQIEFNLEVPELNTAYLSPDGSSTGTPWVSKESDDERWSKELFDLSWMIGVGGNINVKTSRLIHRGENYDRFIMESVLGAERLQLTRLSFERFGGRIDLVGTLTGGKVPGLNASFTLYNGDLAEMINNIADFSQITGRISMSGSVATSGINILSWLRQADIKLVIAARGIRVQNFNLRGIIDAVLAAHSVADVTTNVNKVFGLGYTDFSVDGNINILGGVARTPGLNLESPYGKGVLNAEFEMIPWKMAMTTLYQLPALRSETVPTLTVDVAGTPEEYSTKIDTSSLEAFVAKRVVGQ